MLDNEIVFVLCSICLDRTADYFIDKKLKKKEEDEDKIIKFHKCPRFTCHTINFSLKKNLYDTHKIMKYVITVINETCVV